MKTCPVCGAQMPDSQNLCPACGADYVEEIGRASCRERV